MAWAVASGAAGSENQGTGAFLLAKGMFIPIAKIKRYAALLCKRINQSGGSSMYDKNSSSIKADSWQDLFATMERMVGVPCDPSIDALAWRLWMVSLLSLPADKRLGDTRPDRGLRYVGRAPMGGDVYEVVEPFHDFKPSLGWFWEQCSINPSSTEGIQAAANLEIVIDGVRSVKVFFSGEKSCWRPVSITHKTGSGLDDHFGISVELPDDLNPQAGVVAKMPSEKFLKGLYPKVAYPLPTW